MTMEGQLQKRESRGNIDGRQRPLMLKDFLNDTNSTHVSKKRRRHRPGSSESPTTVRFILEMESESKKRALQGSGSGIGSSKLAMSTRSALQKASEVLVKILPCSVCATKLGPLQKIDFVRESLSLKGTISDRLSAVMRSLSCRSQHNKREAEIQVRVRDIMGWTSFADEEIMYSEYRNTKTLSEKEAHLQTPDRTLDSFSSSRTSSCTWSDIGQESDSASNLHSSSDGSVCSGGADGLKDGMPFLNYHSKKEDSVPTEGTLVLEYFERPKTDIPIESLGLNPAGGIANSGVGLDSLDTADAHCTDGQEGGSSGDQKTCADFDGVSRSRRCIEIDYPFNYLKKQSDVQQLKRAGHGCAAICDVESYQEKEQLSPLSVLDFPFEDEVTTTFVENIPNIRWTKEQLLQNCQNETIAEPDSVDLNKCFASSIFEYAVEDSEDFTEYYDGNSGDYLDNVVEIEDVDDRIMEVLNEYLNTKEKRQWGSFGSLVIDVFREESSFGSQLNEDQLVKAVTRRIKEWLAKGNEMDENREYPLKETDINQYWKSFGIDDEMAAEMVIAVFRFLVDELLFDLMDSKAFASGRI